jgi:DNA polymerase-3 subunit epsilon
MNKNIDDIEFSIFDTETTGLDPQAGDRIVEIAALRFKGPQKIAEFSSLINSGRPVSEAAFNVNKISVDMLKDAPLPAEVYPKFIAFIQGSCLCSYNAGFDLEFLNNELSLTKQPILKDIPVVDILKMSKRLLPGLKRYALWFVAENLGIKFVQQHRAFSDVELTLVVFNRLKEILSSKGLDDYNKFLGLFSIDPVLLMNINNQKIAQIQEAINLKVMLRIEYLASSNAQITLRNVMPKEIRKEGQHNYLMGYCCLKREERLFRVDNILHIEIVNES